MQINIAKVDPDTGVMIPGAFDTIAICGYVRRKGLGDEAFYRLSKDKGFFNEHK